MGSVPTDTHTHARTHKRPCHRYFEKNGGSTKASAYSSRVFALSKLNSYYLTVLSFVQSAGSEGSISYCRFSPFSHAVLKETAVRFFLVS